MKNSIIKGLSNALFGVLFVGFIFVPPHTFAATYPMPAMGNDIVGQTFQVTAKRGDTIVKLAREYDISLHEMLEANQHLNPRRLRAGQKVNIPAQFVLPKFRKGIVINLAELRLYYFTPDGRYVKTYPVGVGRRQWRTPPTSTYVVRKKEYPEWNVPKSIKEYTLAKYGKELPDVVPGGVPDNPLGDYAIYLGKRGILIHGTNQPNSVGKFVSSGCIRLYAKDIEELYFEVKKGTPVHIVNYGQKAGWKDGKLYLESHIPVNLQKEEESALNHDSHETAIQEVLNRPAFVDWGHAHAVTENRNGVPQQIGHGTRY